MSRAEAEKAVGIECYVTLGPPCPAKAKSTPDDFRVEEQTTALDITQQDRTDYYPLYRVEKRSIDTMHMAKELGEALRSKISYGGLKDKRSVSIQYVTPTSLRSARPARVVNERFSASLVGYVPRPLSRASMAGNRFLVVLRECCQGIARSVVETMKFAEEGRLPNFYGMQRFGAAGAGTHRIGKAIVKRRFEDAVRLMLLEGLSNDEGAASSGDAVSAGNFTELVRFLPPGKDIERAVALELSRHPGEWVRALRAVPVKLRRLYVQAYQSSIFNKSLSLAIREGEDISKFLPGDNWAEASEDGLVPGRVRGVKDVCSPRAVPMVQIVGYAFRDYSSRFDKLTLEIMRAEEVTPKQFYVQEMQEVSAEGSFRRPGMAIRDPSWEVQGGTTTLEFTLAKGQYATTLLREIIKPDDPRAAGLA